MNILIVYAHPNAKSFCRAILETSIEGLESRGHQVRVRDLYVLKFNPILSGEDFVSLKAGVIPTDILNEQNEIHWAHLILIIHPIWWTSMPAILKGYFDRVFCFGFAFSSRLGKPFGLLSEKSAYIINTLGNSHEQYESSGMFKSLSQTFEMGVLDFSGIKVLGHTYFSSVPSISFEERVKMLQEVKSIVAQF